LSAPSFKIVAGFIALAVVVLVGDGEQGRLAMRSGYPAILCFAGAVVFFACALIMRKSRLKEKPPESVDAAWWNERRKKIRIASWLCLVMGLVLVAGAIFIEIHGITR